MKIIVYGAGVMAQYVKESVINSGNEFVGLVDPLGNGDFKNLKENNVDFDAIIDFSHFSLLEDVLEAGINKKVPVLIATTGHSEAQIKEIEEAANQIPIIKATNTSVGVNIVNEIVAFATKLLKDFDIEIIEIKHEALSRKMFSDGAVRAVEFLFGKKAGLYTMKDVLGL